MTKKTMSAAVAAAASAKTTVSKDKLMKLRQKIAEARDLELEIESKQVIIDELSAKLTRIRTEELPSIFDEAGVIGSITLEATGNEPAYEAKLIPYYNAILPEDPKIRAQAFKKFKWLAELSKTEFKIPFGKGDEKKAVAFQKLLKSKKIDASIKVGVHASTLTAEVRRRFEGGKPLSQADMKLLGAVAGTVVKLSKI